MSYTNNEEKIGDLSPIVQEIDAINTRLDGGASEVDFENVGTGLEADNAQDAIVEVNSNLTNIVADYGSSTYNTLDAMIGKWISLGMLVDLSGNPDPTTFQGIKNAVVQNTHNQILSVGDEVVASDGEVYVVIHLDYKLSTYGRNVVFAKKYCMELTKQMNPTITNAGGFNASALCQYLNGDFYNTLPTDMKPYISEFTYEGGVGGSSGYAVQNETHKIWLPLEYNVFGATTFSVQAEVSVGLAQQFDYFLTQANRVKTLGSNGVAYPWWLSSPSAGNSTHFCLVRQTGTADNNSTATAYGVLPCFAILAD